MRRDGQSVRISAPINLVASKRDGGVQLYHLQRNRTMDDHSDWPRYTAMADPHANAGATRHMGRLSRDDAAVDAVRGRYLSKQRHCGEMSVRPEPCESESPRTAYRIRYDKPPVAASIMVHTAHPPTTATDRPTAPPSKPSAALAGNLSVNISWVPPFSLPGVTTWYTVVVDGIAAERVVGRSYYIYRYTGNVPCQNHSIAVVAGNAAGDSGPSEPLLTDIPQGEGGGGGGWGVCLCACT